MKIKTAFIRVHKINNTTELKEVKVKEVFLFENELFFIHRNDSKSAWGISHYQTGSAVCRHAPTILAAKTAFQKRMAENAGRLREAVDHILKEHGAANVPPEKYTQTGSN